MNEKSRGKGKKREGFGEEPTRKRKRRLEEARMVSGRLSEDRKSERKLEG